MLYMTFWEFARSNGCKLLKDDVSFVRACLKKIHKGRHRLLLRVYVERWQTGMANCSNLNASDNAGRRCANLYLLGELDEARRSG